MAQIGKPLRKFRSVPLTEEPRADPAEPRCAYNLGNALYAHGDLTAAIAQAINAQTFEESYQLSIRTDRAALTFSSTHAVPRIYPTESFAHGLVQQHG